MPFGSQWGLGCLGWLSWGDEISLIQHLSVHLLRYVYCNSDDDDDDVKVAQIKTTVPTEATKCIMEI